MALNFTPNSVTLFLGSPYLISFVGSNFPSVPNFGVGFIGGSSPTTVPGMYGIPTGDGPEGLNFLLGGLPPVPPPVFLNPGTPTIPGPYTINLALLDELDQPIPGTETEITVNVINCVVTTPPNIIVNTIPGECRQLVNFPPPTLSPGGCGVVTTIPANNTYFPKGVNVVQCYIDGILVPGKTFTVTVNDNEPPVFTSCPANIVVDATSPDGAIVNYPFPTATDNCPGVNVFQIQGYASGDLVPVGVFQCIYKAQDTSGNFASPDCIFTITVNPYVPPVPKKKNRRIGSPLCFNPSAFPDGVCPKIFDYKANGRITRLYRIGDTCCYTPNQNQR